MTDKITSYTLAALLLSSQALPCPASLWQQSTVSDTITTVSENQWKGKKVAFLGDSITDKKHVGTTKNYWQYLAEMLGLTPLVYGINGNQWNGILKQAERLKAEAGDNVDAIIVFCGTNDYNAGIPLGEWYTYTYEETTVKGGTKEVRKKRHAAPNPHTFRGRINEAMLYLKKNFPMKQIILLIPNETNYPADSHPPCPSKIQQGKHPTRRIVSQQTGIVCRRICERCKRSCQRMGSTRYRPEQHQRAVSFAGRTCSILPRCTD